MLIYRVTSDIPQPALLPLASMLPELSEYREDDPEALYLGGDFELLARADGVFIVENVALPVHTVLLKERCGLMKRLLKNGSKAALGTGGIPLVHHVAAGHVLEVIMCDALTSESPRSLEGFTLKRVAHFLRFLYHPAEVSTVDFGLPGAAKSLSACARLAFRLEVGPLLEALDAHMEETVDAHQPPLHRLMDWAAVAEECGLTRLWTKCVREIAVTLARGRKGVSPRSTSQLNLSACNEGEQVMTPTDATRTAVHDVLILQDMTPKTQMAVMATLLASLRKVPGDASHLVPHEASLAAALPTLTPNGSPAAELRNEN